MDSIKQNLENAKNKGKDYYNQMTGQQNSDASQYAEQAKTKANEGMDKTKQTAKDYMPNQAGDH
ncbi:hypothetical protein AnigIFM60653_000561 [Aspergillus niger]|uniref:Contig An04c0070, genomic contig n=5 Tax=Aspergillus TaxID=5052 RepID=A2QHU4_ASPNC|nr:uncharacterized protein An04g01070 [Aspergillus niger]XP_025451130.1 uncharacterized protein BO96DRAFT_449195 [Aspergillus niger CBS 101883]XP_026627234.1 hypothetical protein BDQ94DRAFT_169733 [Aspergillus welwitschiae]RDH21063.1 hypothetical protein M747DRAFT_369941 [Aspergillus niger ATCC 13496]RDK36831.1 hypothetical protein M752DRAFT_110643 [Aspergillus phoenicis ATCC 13157]PYH53075.1 hypothetical protein BO96DRAFT_449195 [Aspergillus niger CBS 101883]RDH34212.1 hypothetical protein B|eukprot:XP_001401472.1 hypothetical protein ANI_1_250184 [Aspergillus niger CBS 513.88]